MMSVGREQNRLTRAERAELCDRIAGGEITRSCTRRKVDWFNIALSTGRRVCGAYEWGSEDAEYVRLVIYEKGRRLR
jgi:hypothetical protein